MNRAASIRAQFYDESLLILSAKDQIITGSKFLGRSRKVEVQPHGSSVSLRMETGGNLLASCLGRTPAGVARYGF